MEKKISRILEEIILKHENSGDKSGSDDSRDDKNSIKTYNYSNNVIKKLFKQDSCICDLINKRATKKKCKCKDLLYFNNQGKSGAQIYSAKCTKSKNINKSTKRTKKVKNSNNSSTNLQTNLHNTIIKTTKMKNNYFQILYKTKIKQINKPNQENCLSDNNTKKNKLFEYDYYFVKIDRFLIQPIINQIICEYLPYNTINFDEYGICNNDNNLIGYIRMYIAKLGDLHIFFNNLINNHLTFNT